MRRKRRKRANPWRVIMLLLLIATVIYINQMVVPTTPPLFIPTVTPTTSSESFINQAESLYTEGKLSQAIDAYENAILSEPENSSYYVALARVQILAGHYDDGLENAELALLRNSDNPVAHAMRA